MWCVFEPVIPPYSLTRNKHAILSVFLWITWNFWNMIQRTDYFVGIKPSHVVCLQLEVGYFQAQNTERTSFNSRTWSMSQVRGSKPLCKTHFVIPASPAVWPSPPSWSHTHTPPSVHASVLWPHCRQVTCAPYACAAISTHFTHSFKNQAARDIPNQQRALSCTTDLHFGFLCALSRQSLPGWKCVCHNQSPRCEW